MVHQDQETSETVVEVFHLVGRGKQGVQLQCRVLSVFSEGKQRRIFAVSDKQVELSAVGKQFNIFDGFNPNPIFENVLRFFGKLDEVELICGE